MSTITREQLCERAREKVISLEFAVTQTAFADSRADLEEELELARIALASLEAEPVEWRVVFKLDGQTGSDFETTFESQAKMNEIISLHERAGFSARITPLYNTPPAPVSVPEGVASTIESLKQTLVDCNRYNYCFDAVKRVEDACRAAMLQGADGNSPVIQDGWADMLQRWLVFGRGMQNAGSQLPRNLIAETEAMLTSAPQQECKHEFVYGWHSYGSKSGYQCRFCGKLQEVKP